MSDDKTAHLGKGFQLRLAQLLIFALPLILALPPTEGQRRKVPRTSKGTRSVERKEFKTEIFHPCNARIGAEEVLVKFARPVPAGGVREFVRRDIMRGFEKERAVMAKEAGTEGTLYLVHIDGLNVNELLSRFRTRMSARMKEDEYDIVFVEPNFILSADAIPNDPRFTTRQRSLFDTAIGGGGISAVSAWDKSTGSRDVVVGVIDSGVWYTHDDLKNNMWRAPREFVVRVGGEDIRCGEGAFGFNALSKKCDPLEDDDGMPHGTEISGLIGAEGNNGIGIAGVNWKTRILGIKFLNQRLQGSICDAVNAISFAIEVDKQRDLADIRVLNNSYGYTATSGDDLCKSKSLEEVIRKASDQGILFVTSAGNDGMNTDDQPHYPSGFDVPNVVSVGATTTTDRRPDFSNRGVQSVDLGAPGTRLFSTVPPNGFNFLSTGTSYSAAFVSGSAALVLSKCSTFTPASLRACILNNSDTVGLLSGHFANGRRLNVNRAITDCAKCPQ